ncbi:MAG: xanthine dehydrogenase accessory protein XdhC [Halocynthiibacter sp.]
MSFDVAEIALACAAHGPVCRVLVVATKGSAPRGAGTSMLVWNGGQSGTIGGGALEFGAAGEALRSRSSHRLHVQPLGPALGQCCGGSVTLLWEWFDIDGLQGLDPAEGAYLRPVSPSAARRAPSALIARMTNGATGPALFDGWLGEAFGLARKPIWIYGAGHVGRAVAACLGPLPDFSVTLIDTSAARLPDPLPEGIIPAIAPDPARLVSHAPHDTHHLIMTYSHKLDLEICHQVLGQEFASAGLIGSATKWVRFQTRLQRLGHGSAQIGRISCPIGDPRLGKHPQEIAIGVARAFLSTQNRVAKNRVAAPEEIAS